MVRRGQSIPPTISSGLPALAFAFRLAAGVSSKSATSISSIDVSVSDSIVIVAASLLALLRGLDTAPSRLDDPSRRCEVPPVLRRRESVVAVRRTGRVGVFLCILKLSLVEWQTRCGIRMNDFTFDKLKQKRNKVWTNKTKTAIYRDRRHGDESNLPKRPGPQSGRLLLESLASTFIPLQYLSR